MRDSHGNLLPAALDASVDHLLARSLVPPPMRPGARTRILEQLAATARKPAPPRRPRGWLKWFLFPALAATAAVILIPRLRPRPVGFVTEAASPLELVNDGNVRSGVAGTPLRQGDIVHPGRDGAKLRIGGRADVWMDGASELEVGTGRWAVRVRRGRAVFDVAPSGEVFRVDTVVGTVTVKGTQFDVRVLSRPPGPTVALVHLLAGSVLCDSPEGQLALAPGQTVLLAQGAAPRRVRDGLGGGSALEFRDPRTGPVDATGGLPDCTKTDGPDCQGLGGAVRALAAMEERISEDERHALTEAVAVAQGNAMGDLRHLHAEADGQPAPAHFTYDDLVKGIEAALPEGELRKAEQEPDPGSGDSPGSVAQRLVRIERDVSDGTRNELRKRVPLHRLSSVLSVGQRRQQTKPEENRK